MSSWQILCHCMVYRNNHHFHDAFLGHVTMTMSSKWATNNEWNWKHISSSDIIIAYGLFISNICFVLYFWIFNRKRLKCNRLQKNQNNQPTMPFLHKMHLVCKPSLACCFVIDQYTLKSFLTYVFHFLFSLDIEKRKYSRIYTVHFTRFWFSKPTCRFCTAELDLGWLTLDTHQKQRAYNGLY